MVEHYVVQLLAGYAAQQIESTPLALRMLAAAEAPPRERRRHLRDIGDTSLYVSGFWSESLERRAWSTSTTTSRWAAPRTASWRAAGGARPAIRSATCSASWRVNFVRFVGALALISRRVAHARRSDRDILRLYRQWQRTKSANAAAPPGRAGRGPAEGRRTPAVRRRRGDAARSLLARLQLGLEALYRVRDAARDRRVRHRRRARATRCSRRARRASSCWCARTTASWRWRCSSTRRRWRTWSGTTRRRASTTATSPTSAWPSRASATSSTCALRRRAAPAGVAAGAGAAGGGRQVRLLRAAARR